MRKLLFAFAIVGLMMGCQKSDTSVTPPTTYAPVPTEEPKLYDVGLGGGDSSTREAEVLPLNDNR